MHVGDLFRLLVEVPLEQLERFGIIDLHAESRHQDVVQHVHLLIAPRKNLVVAFVSGFQGEHVAIETVKEGVEEL